MITLREDSIDAIDSFWFSSVTYLKHFVIIDVAIRCHYVFTFLFKSDVRDLARSWSTKTLNTSYRSHGFVCRSIFL